MVGVATQRAVELEALLTARTHCQTEYIAMVKSCNECQLKSYISGMLIQPDLCRRARRLVSVSRSVPPNIAQTERVLTRLVIAPHLCESFSPSVSSQKSVAHVIHVLIASHPVLSCPCCTHNLRHHYTRTLKMVGSRWFTAAKYATSSLRGTRGYVIHDDDGEMEADLMEPDELFARMVNLKNEVVQLSDGSRRHAHSGQSEVITGYAAKWTTWQ